MRATGLEKVGFIFIPKKGNDNVQTTAQLHSFRTSTSLVAQTVKRLPTMWETWVQSLGWKISWRRKWQSTPVPLPGKSHRQTRLVVYSPWGRKESDTTEQLHFQTFLPFEYDLLISSNSCKYLSTVSRLTI